MRLRFFHEADLGETLWTAHLQFAKQVTPFVCDLTGRCPELNPSSNRIDFLGVEGVSAQLRLLEYRDEISIDGGTRRRVRAKPFQLRMMTIADSVAAQDRACQ